MVTNVRKWGNSLGVRLPKALAKEAGLAEGSQVDVRVARGTIVLKPVRRPRYTLASLLAGVRPENIHAEIDVGEPRGREIL